MIVMNPSGRSSLMRPSARRSSGGGTPCEVPAMRPGRAPRPAVARVAKNRPEVGVNAACMPNLGSLSCKVEKKARETRTKKQLHKPEEVLKKCRRIRKVYIANFPWWMCSKRSVYLGILRVRSRVSWILRTVIGYKEMRSCWTWKHVPWRSASYE